MDSWLVPVLARALEPFPVPLRTLDALHLAAVAFLRGRGCDACNNTGYKGRVGLFELMVLNDTIRDMVMGNASTDDIRSEAQKNGMITLREFGMGLASEGITSLEEVIRETIEEG
jgi:type IV pilus assembly protein PilB